MPLPEAPQPHSSQINLRNRLSKVLCRTEPFDLCDVSLRRPKVRELKRTLKETEFIKLLREQEGKLLRVAWAIVGQEADAWDVLQESVELAWLNRRQLRGGTAAFPAWIRRIVVNQSFNYTRRSRRAIPVEPGAMPEPEPMPAPEADLEAREIWDELQRLNPDQRQVVVLRFLADLPLSDIATELEVPLGTVKSRLNRALEQLNQSLASQRGVSS
jgi:RNA polymerase sigma-70 factor, ECF subfamily